MRLLQGQQSSRVTLDGREVLLLCSNNYLGLAEHPAVKEAAISAVNRFGAGSGASRLVSGNMELHEALEVRIAEFKRTEAALLFNSGYAANTGVISALVGRGDAIFSDRFNHASILDGCLLSRARLVRYPHNDMAALRKLLEATPCTGRRLIVSDGVFSMDGDLAPLREIVELKKKYNALLLVDDAHGTGVLGNGGRGSAELFNVAAAVDLQMGTLGKALGSFGAYVAASHEIVSYLVNRARSFIFSTSLPPSVLAAAIAAIDVVDSPEGADLRLNLQTNAGLFRDALATAGFNTMGSRTQIVPVFAGEAEKVMAFSQHLLDDGIFVQGIRPPTVPVGECRLRCTLMATHSKSDIEQAVTAITAAGKKLRII
jgi:glycine C-acetyltransferase